VDDLAIADAVTDGENGLLVAEDPQALAAAADRVLGDPALRSAMSAASLTRADGLCIDRQAAKLIAIYEGLAAEHPSPRRSVVGTGPVGRRVVRQLGSLRRRGTRIMRRYL
jgi:hypothetical protein